VSERREFVLQAPLGRTLWSLSWPIVLSNQISILSLGVLLFWFGRLAGETGLVVESLFRPFGLLVIWSFGAAQTGASVLVSRSVGAADGRGLSIAAGGMTLAIAMWATFAAIILPLSPWLASALAGDLPVAQPMLHYLLAFVLVNIPGFVLAGVLLDVASATGATKLNLVRVLIDLAFMAALTPFFMEVVGLGVAGGPLSSGIAALALVPIVWLTLSRRRATLALGELGTGAWRIRWRLWRDILAIGAPVQVGRVVTFALQLVIVHLVVRDGSASIAGYGIALALLLFGAMTTMALAQGGSILIGQCLGAGLHDRARRGLRVTLLAGWGVMALFVLMTVFFDRQLVAIFTSDPDVVEASRHALAIVRWAGFGGSTFQILLSAFAAHRATVRASMLVIGAEAVALLVAFIWPGTHLEAACFSVVAANILKGGFLIALLAVGGLKERPRRAA
jgi:Na+-driven multidrug efflux pump